LKLIYVPDGKSKTMSGLSSKVDVSKFMKGDEKVKKENKEEQVTENPNTNNKKENVDKKKENKKGENNNNKNDKNDNDKNDPLVHFSRMKFIVGQIKNAYKHKDADKLYCEEIDIGESKPRNIASGLVG